MNINPELLMNYNRFVNYARALGIARDTAEDVVQDALVRVLKADFIPSKKGMDVAFVFQNIRWCAYTVFAGRNESDTTNDDPDNDIDQGVSFWPGYSFGGLRPTEFLAEVELAVSALSDIERHFYLSAIFDLSKNQALDMLPFVFVNCNADLKQIMITRGEIKRLRDERSAVDFVEIRRRLHYTCGREWRYRFRQ